MGTRGTEYLRSGKRGAEVPRTAAVLGYAKRQRAKFGKVEMKTEKSPEALLSYQLPGGQGRALRGSVIAGIPQT
jgi:hypothetical protein